MNHSTPNCLSRLEHIDCREKRVLLRADLNVPVVNGEVQSQQRIEAVLPTLKYLLSNHAAVLVVSHLGRPPVGLCSPNHSLQPVAETLSQLLNIDVPLAKNWPTEDATVQPGQVILAENVRCLAGELENSPELAKRMAKHIDIVVLDAFACAHRAHASTEALLRAAPRAVAGPLLLREMDALSRAMDQSKAPTLAIIGGAKVSSKIQLIRHLIAQNDTVIIGGGMANTFLMARGYPIGKSLVEPDWLALAREMDDQAQQSGKQLILPTDVCAVDDCLDNTNSARVLPVADIAHNQLIVDIGPQTAQRYRQLVQNAKTVIWNGPLGIFEIPAYAQGTRALADAFKQHHGFSIAGGGDTLHAIEQCDATADFSYLSTGGGAFLQYLEGSPLPGIEALHQANTKS
jgi:phosphoglycerate kinase